MTPGHPWHHLTLEPPPPPLPPPAAGRWNIEAVPHTDDILVCRGDHPKHFACWMTRYTPAEAVEESGRRLHEDAAAIKAELKKLDGQLMPGGVEIVARAVGIARKLRGAS